jgi:hypothetical protein
MFAVMMVLLLSNGMYVLKLRRGDCTWETRHHANLTFELLHIAVAASALELRMNSGV